MLTPRFPSLAFVSANSDAATRTHIHMNSHAHGEGSWGGEEGKFAPTSRECNLKDFTQQKEK